MEGVFFIPSFVGTEADNNLRLPGRPGSRLSKCIVGLFCGTHFQHGGKIRPPKTVPQCTLTTTLYAGDRVEMVVKVHCGTVLGDVFLTWRRIRPQKQSHNALWQPSRPGLPLNLKVANRGRYKEKNSHGYDRRDWVQVGNQYSNLGNTGCKHQGSSGFAWLGTITEYVQKRNQIISSYGLQQTRCPVKLVPK